MYLKAYANHLLGVKLWQLSACSIMAFPSAYFRLKIVWQVEHTWENADTNLAEIRYKMSELFDKEVTAQKESMKNFRGSRKLP